VKLTVVGCSGSFPGPRSPASCYLVSAEDPGGRTWRILLDLGNGALGALQRHIDPMSLNAIVLSHLHPDHCLDVCGLYVMRKYHPGAPRERLPIHGPTGTAARLARAYDPAPDADLTDEFSFGEYDDKPGPIVIGPFEVTPVRVDHPVPTYALRVEQAGRVLVYSADTGPCAALVCAARDADLFVCEASFVEGANNPAGLHLTGRQAAEHAAAAGADRLLLTHIPPWHDERKVLVEAQPHFAGVLALAEPDATYDV
jgi:ribonuclease BN (tRNA processing enzyme)